VSAWHLAARARRHLVAVTVTGGLLAVGTAGAMTVAACQPMTVTQCLVQAGGTLLGASVIAIAARAAWLGFATARAVAALPHTSCPATLASAARRLGIRRLRCLAAGAGPAFCAGLALPVVYVTVAGAALSPGQLDAVLAHEAAHARRRDPLRRLLARATADIMFYLPLARWWSFRQAETAELRADQAAIGYAGRAAVAAALLTAGAAGSPAGALAYGGATSARVAQLLGDDLPARRPAPVVLVVTMLGLTAAVWLAMCAGDNILGMIGRL
jgi:Zn-dependent protease with chaperone function